MKKIRFYAPMYFLAAGLTFMSPSINAYAEEAASTESEEASLESKESEIATTSSEEEEVLFEQTEDDEYQLEDIEDESQKSDEQKAQEEAAKAEEEAKAQEEAAKAQEEAARIENEKAAQEAIIGSTTIDAEDQGYNTGRSEIPDTVLTEAERKGIGKIPENPGNPEQPENPGNPGNPGTPTDSGTPETSTGTPETKIEIPIVPTTGIDLKNAFIGGIGLGGVIASISIIGELSRANRVTKSRKKFGKKAKKENTLSR